MKKTFFYKLIILCFVVLLALPGTTSYKVYAGTGNINNTKDNNGIGDTGNTENNNGNGNNDTTENNNGNGDTGNTEDNNGNGDINNTEDNNSNGDTGNTEDNNGNGNTGNTDDNNGNGDTGNTDDNNSNGDTDNTENNNDNENTDNTDDKKNNKEKNGIVVQIGKNKKTVKILKGSFVKKKGIKYFKEQNGKLVKNRFFCKSQNVYYVNGKGEVSLGWNKIKGHYYFFDRKSGKMAINKKADKIKITKRGIAKETSQNIQIIKVYIEAQNVVQNVSKPDNSKSEKLYKCYLWIAKFQYKRYRTMKEAKTSNPNDWDIVFANDIFKKHNGCCASEACAFAYMAKVCGYEDVSICSDTGHAWVDIGGKLYDPLFAEARSFKANYNANYSDYRIHPVYKKKL